MNFVGVVVTSKTIQGHRKSIQTCQ